MKDETVFTVQEVADQLKISKNTIYEMIKRGDVLAYKVGNKMRISASELDNYKQRALKGQGGRSVPPRSLASQPEGGGAVWQDMDSNTLQNGFVISGQDVALDVLVRYLQVEAKMPYILRSFDGSYNGLFSLYQGKAHIASSHLWDAKANVYNVPFIERMLPDVPAIIIRLFKRQQGFYVLKGNPKNIHDWQDLARKDVKMINREKGSGTRLLVYQHLRKQGIDPQKVNGFDNECTSHFETASAVSRGEADVSVGTYINSKMVSGIDFLPMQQECYDIVIRKEDWDKPMFQMVYQIICSERYQMELQSMGGYDLSETGTIVAET